MRWADLSQDRQLEVLTRLCLHRRRNFQREFSGILSVGVGYKTSKGRLLPSLCLAFLVYRKKRSKRPVPPSIATYAQIGGRRVRLEVPTDVEEAADGGPQASINAASGVVVSAAVDPSVRCTGAVCCLARQRDTPQNLYLLGCHHVLALSSETANCNAEPGVVSSPAGVPFARLFDHVAMAADVSSQMDAAIALVLPGVQVAWSHNGMRALRVDAGTQQPSDCRVFTPRGAFAAAYVKTWVEVPLWYPRCGWVQFERAYQFQAPTQSGDSGSAVMGLDGTLFAMHFWGRPSDQFAMAVPAGSLFQRGLFDVEIELAL